jgi:hypothetical protein
MAQKNYTYKWQGVSAAFLAQVPGSGSGAASVPIVLQTITWDETYKDDLDFAMASAGWVYAYEGTAPAAKTIAQLVPAFLAADGASIADEDGWTTAKSGTLTSKGNTAVGVVVTAIGNTNLGQASVRVRVSGGAYSNTVVGAVQYDIPPTSYGEAGFNIPVPLADTSPNDTTYTFDLQYSVVGAGSTVVPRKGSGMSLVEHR